LQQVHQEWILVGEGEEGWEWSVQGTQRVQKIQMCETCLIESVEMYAEIRQIFCEIIFIRNNKMHSLL
jgi:hypothetical protein